MLISWLRNEMFRPLYEAEEGTPTGGTTDPAVSLPTQSEAEPADDFDKPRALETIRKQREEAKALRAQLKELDALKAEKQQRDEAELSAAEKAEKRAADLEAKYTAAQAQLKRATLKDAVAEAAQKHNLTFAQGALSDALALGIFDSLEWDGGTPKGVGAAVKELSTARPYLFAQPAAVPDIGATAKGKASKESDLTSLAQRWGIKVGS